MDIVKIAPIKLSQDGQRVDGEIQVGDQTYPIYFQTRRCTFRAEYGGILGAGFIAGDEKKDRGD